MKILIWYNQENTDNFDLLYFDLCKWILGYFLFLFLVIKKVDKYFVHTFSTVFNIYIYIIYKINIYNYIKYIFKINIKINT